MHYLFVEVGRGEEKVAGVGHVHNQVWPTALDDWVGVDDANALQIKKLMHGGVSSYR
jgi:hypothetical protein